MIPAPTTMIFFFMAKDYHNLARCKNQIEILSFIIMRAKKFAGVFPI